MTQAAASIKNNFKKNNLQICSRLYFLRKNTTTININIVNTKKHVKSVFIFSNGGKNKRPATLNIFKKYPSHFPLATPEPYSPIILPDMDTRKNKCKESVVPSQISHTKHSRHFCLSV